MSADWINKMFDELEAKRQSDKQRHEIDYLNHKRIIALIPEFWESIREMTERCLERFNDRMQPTKRFKISPPIEYRLEAKKPSYPRAILDIGIHCELTILSVQCRVDTEKTSWSYRLQLEDGSIYLERTKDKSHATLDEVEREVFEPFFSAILHL